MLLFNALALALAQAAFPYTSTSTDHGWEQIKTRRDSAAPTTLAFDALVHSWDTIKTLDSAAQSLLPLNALVLT